MGTEMGTLAKNGLKIVEERSQKTKFKILCYAKFFFSFGKLK